MSFYDIVIIGLNNLRRTRFRAVLTIIGVIVGIGTLVSMVSFGLGMQKNITDSIQNNDLVLGLTVSQQKTDLQKIQEGQIPDMGDSLLLNTGNILNDSVLQIFNTLKGVEYAFPKIKFPAKIKINGYSKDIQTGAIPNSAANIPPFNRLKAGAFFSADTCNEILLTEELLNRLGFKSAWDNDEFEKLTSDTNIKKDIVLIDSIMGSEITITTLSLQSTNIQAMALQAVFSSRFDPFKKIENKFKVVGIIKKQEDDMAPNRMYNANVYIPIKVAAHIPRVSFDNVYDILNNQIEDDGSYSSVFVRLENLKYFDEVKEEIKQMGFQTFSVMDQMDEIRKAFIIFDALFGVIGIISLFVASLGIINTMIMSIMERTREIGIMKSIGGGEHEIRQIFFVEAGTIGLIGGVLGVILGYLVTEVANVILNATVIKHVQTKVDLFYIPWWLVLGSIAFAMLVSLLAGLYPANRAARIDPVKALRHD